MKSIKNKKIGGRLIQQSNYNKLWNELQSKSKQIKQLVIRKIKHRAKWVRTRHNTMKWWEGPQNYNNVRAYTSRQKNLIIDKLSPEKNVALLVKQGVVFWRIIGKTGKKPYVVNSRTCQNIGKMIVASLNLEELGRIQLAIDGAISRFNSA